MRREGEGLVERETRGPRATWLPWAEAVVLSLAVALLGRWIRPADPLFFEGPFCWPVLVVLLVGLHHGLAPGLVSAGVLGLGLALASGTFLSEALIGLLVTAVVSGEFHGNWSRRLVRAESICGEQRTELERLSRSYHLLRASHARLEERLAGGAPSLREVLSQLEGQLAEVPASEERLRAMGEALLGLVASHCGVQTAALYALTEEERLEAEPVAVLGGCRASDEDPLVRESLRTGRLVSACSFMDIREDSGLLVVLPLVGGGGRLRGVLAISEMRFTAFHHDTLLLLAVLGEHVGELLARTAPGTCSEKEYQRYSRRVASGLVAPGLECLSRPMPEVP
jgi:polysaccharide biosynthesis protein PelD